jgi:hypothetical protein
VAPALLIVIQQDADAGLVDRAVAAQAADYVSAVAVAVRAVKDGSAACATTDQADTATCVLQTLKISLDAGDQLLANPALNKLIGDAAGPRVAAALKAARTASWRPRTSRRPPHLPTRRRSRRRPWRRCSS